MKSKTSFTGVLGVLYSPCHLASIPLIVSYVAGHDLNVDVGRTAFYSFVFTTCFFIVATGVICTILGKMLGRGKYTCIVKGVILVWFSLDFLGLATCSVPGWMMVKRSVRGGGASIPGLANGVFRFMHVWLYRAHSGHSYLTFHNR